MTHILISFLGRTSKAQNGYQKTRYRFPDGAATEETAFIGWSLRERLRPDRLVILGTGGSMWDYLVESLPLGNDVGESERLDLQEATGDKAVSQALLDRIQPLVRQALGCEVALVVIPYGKEQSEQIEILRLMADQVPENAEVSLDVTHGFRHLPMLALMSALHLRVVRRARIKDIYYGAYDPDTGEAPIYDLSGLLQIADWLDALHTFDKDGDYGVFAPLLKQNGFAPNEANHLHRAAFFERTFNVYGAATELNNASKPLNRELPGIGALFAEQLCERIKWHKAPDPYSRQKQLASFYLNQGDYPRAALFAYEAFVTRLIDKSAGERDSDYRDRMLAEKAFWDGIRGDLALKAPFSLLSEIRNALAHGTAPNTDQAIGVQKEIRERARGILKEEIRLKKELSGLISTLLP